MNFLSFRSYFYPITLLSGTTHQFGLPDPLLYDLLKREPPHPSRETLASAGSTPEADATPEEAPSPAPVRVKKPRSGTGLLAALRRKTNRRPGPALPAPQARKVRIFSRVLAAAQRKADRCLQLLLATPQGIRNAHYWLRVTLPKGTVATIKGFRSRTLAVTAENGVIRVVILQGQEVVGWGSIPWGPEPGETETAEDGGPAGPEVRFQKLLDDLGFQPSKVWHWMARVGIYRTRLLTDMSLNSTVIRYLQIPRVKKRYLEPVVISEVLDSIPFEQDEVDISWHLRKVSGHQEAFAVAVPKDHINARVKLFSDTGVFPAAAYTRASALALAGGAPGVIVLNLEQGQADIVLVQEGLPQVVHQVHPPPTEGDPSEQVELLARAIEQVSGYYQPLGQRDGYEPLPVTLTGALAHDTPLSQALQAALGRDVIPFSPPVSYPEEFPAEEYAVNTGLFLVQQARPNTRENVPNHGLPSLNLLPVRHMPRAVPVMQAAVFLTLLLVAIHPFDVRLYVESKEQQVAQLTEQLDVLQGRQADRQVILASLRESQDRMTIIEQQETAMDLRLTNLEEEFDVLMDRLEILTSTALPPKTRVFTLSPDGSGFLISGSADTYERALEYVANLREASDYFSGAQLLRAEGTSGEAAVDTPSTQEGGSMEGIFEEFIQEQGTEEEEDASTGLGISFEAKVSTSDRAFAATGQPAEGDDEDEDSS